MNEEQKAQALALYRNERVRAAYGRHCPTVEISTTGTMDAEGRRWWVVVPNLADETGEVEGRLHRVLERLVGEPVCIWPVLLIGEPAGWQAAMLSPAPGKNGRRLSDSYPTRLDAIAAALLALEVKP